MKIYHFTIQISSLQIILVYIHQLIYNDFFTIKWAVIQKTPSLFLLRMFPYIVSMWNMQIFAFLLQRPMKSYGSMAHSHDRYIQSEWGKKWHMARETTPIRVPLKIIYSYKNELQMKSVKINVCMFNYNSIAAFYLFFFRIMGEI